VGWWVHQFKISVRRDEGYGPVSVEMREMHTLVEIHILHHSIAPFPVLCGIRAWRCNKEKKSGWPNSNLKHYIHLCALDLNLTRSLSRPNKIVHTNQQSNLQASCQSVFPLCQHHPNKGQQKNKNCLHQLTIKFM